MKTIVRVEHPDTGCGLFRSDDPNGDNYLDNSRFADQIVMRHHSFPTRWNDLGTHDDDIFCAFKSVDQLKEWITNEEMIDLISIGFRVYMIKAEDVIEGRMQCGFRKDKIVEKTDITKIFHQSWPTKFFPPSKDTGITIASMLKD